MCAHAPIWAIWYAESIVSFRDSSSQQQTRTVCLLSLLLKGSHQLLQTGEEQKAVTTGT